MGPKHNSSRDSNRKKDKGREKDKDKKVEKERPKHKDDKIIDDCCDLLDCLSPPPQISRHMPLYTTSHAAAKTLFDVPQDFALD